MALNPFSNIRSNGKPSRVEVGDVVLHVRRLGTSDAGAIEQHLLALAPLDRRARFFGKLTDEAISAYARRLDPSRAVLIGAFEPSERLVGLAEAHLTDAVRTVEVAVSIDPAFRHRALGQRLVARAYGSVCARRAVSRIQFRSRQSPCRLDGADARRPIRSEAWLRFDRSEYRMAHAPGGLTQRKGINK